MCPQYIHRVITMYSYIPICPNFFLKMDTFNNYVQNNIYMLGNDSNF